MPRPPGCPRALAGFAAALLIAGVRTAAAGGFEGRIAMELEYLGESYFSEQILSAEDLGLPLGSTTLFTDTTRFAEDAWLPGQRLELGWHGGNDLDERITLWSRTSRNEERVWQDLELTGVVPGGTRGRWRFRLLAALREETRSLVGHGDARARVEAQREVPLGGKIQGAFGIGWEHSRTRGDTVSYLYDYDRLEARVRASGGDGWLPSWNVALEGRTKSVPRGEPGGYRELRAGGGWRPGGGAELAGRVSARDYDEDAEVGRDSRNAELEWRQGLWSSGGATLGLQLDALVSDYDGEDELYYDAAEIIAHLPLRPDSGDWNVSAGPALRLLADLSGGDRDFRQWTARLSAGRLLGGGGFAELSLEAGHRAYRSAGAEVIEITSLSAALLRSDYWLVDVLAMLNIPVGGGVTADLLASSSIEEHTGRTERIRVTFVTVGLGKSF